MRPRIGITPSIDRDESVLSVNKKYIDAVIRCGGLPYIMGYTGKALADDMLFFLDGLILSGGGDFDPRFFNEDPHVKCGEINILRDEFEIALCQTAITKKIPILGICRGMQVMAIANGGRIYQDIYTQRENVINHSQTAPRHYTWHKIIIDKRSKLFSIVGEESVFVNSFHHQGVSQMPDCMRESAKTDDGLIEAIEVKEHPFAIGVQWHPEWLFEYPHGNNIFLHFISAAKDTALRKNSV